MPQGIDDMRDPGRLDRVVTMSAPFRSRQFRAVLWAAQWTGSALAVV
jgi:hypothetical protein